MGGSYQIFINDIISLKKISCCCKRSSFITSLSKSSKEKNNKLIHSIIYYSVWNFCDGIQKELRCVFTIYSFLSVPFRIIVSIIVYITCIHIFKVLQCEIRVKTQHHSVHRLEYYIYRGISIFVLFSKHELYQA